MRPARERDPLRTRGPGRSEYRARSRQRGSVRFVGGHVVAAADSGAVASVTATSLVAHKLRAPDVCSMSGGGTFRGSTVEFARRQEADPDAGGVRRPYVTAGLGVATRGAAAFPHGPARATAGRLLAPCPPPAQPGPRSWCGRGRDRGAAGPANSRPSRQARQRESTRPSRHASMRRRMISSRPEAAFQTFTKRAIAVKETRTKSTQSTGTKIDGAQERDAEQEHALGPLHEAALRRETQGLRLRPLVGDQSGHRQDAHGQQREVALSPGRAGTRRSPS